MAPVRKDASPRRNSAESSSRQSLPRIISNQHLTNRNQQQDTRYQRTGERLKPRGTLKIAVRSWLLLIVTLFLAGCQSTRNFPEPHQGLLDLSDWHFDSAGSIPLNGDWQFAPKQLLSGNSEATDTLGLQIPGIWNNRVFDSGQGYGTYIFRLRLPPSAENLAVRLITISSAYRLYANGKLIAQGGVPGDSPFTSAPGYMPGVFVLPETPNGDMTLHLQVSNFHYKKGGAWEPVWLGDYHSLQRERESWMWLSAVLTGALFFIGLHHLMMWLFRRNDVTSLYFAIITISLSLRVTTIDEVFLTIMIPHMPWSLFVRLEYGSLLIGLGSIILFMRSLYPQEYPARFYYPITVGATTYALLLMVLSPLQFSAGLPLIHLMLIYACILTPISMILAVMHQREGALLFTLGALSMCLSSLHDIIITFNKDLTLLTLYGNRVYLQPLGMFIFMLCQSGLMSYRSSRNIARLQETSRELTLAKNSLDDYAQSLELKVHQRTAELQDANEELERISHTDPLTGLWNRRYFDDQLPQLWKSHLRQQRPLSVLMVDIDYFKGINDVYGHLRGDDILKEICQLVVSHLKRPMDMAARYGGEEIVILLPDTTLENAEQLAEELRQAVFQRAIPHVESHYQRLTISIGLTALTAGSLDSPATLLARADTALYEAKLAGRNQVVSRP